MFTNEVACEENKTGSNKMDPWGTSWDINIMSNFIGTFQKNLTKIT